MVEERSRLRMTDISVYLWSLDFNTALSVSVCVCVRERERERERVFVLLNTVLPYYFSQTLFNMCVFII